MHPIRHLLLIIVLTLTALSPIAAQQPRTLVMWVMPSGIDLTRRIGVEVRAFEAANPNIRVEVEFIEWEDALIFFEQASNNLRRTPDVLQVGSTWVSSIASQGLLHTYEQPELEAAGGTSAFAPELWAAGTYDNQVVTVPWFIDTRAIIYRKDIFEQLGIDPEIAFSDWEQFEQTLQTIRDADLFVYTSDQTPLQIYPIAIPGRPETNAVHDFAPWIWGAGGNFLNEDNTVAAFNDEASLRAIQFYTNFYPKGYTPPNIQGFTIRDADLWFLNRRTAMTISGAWLIQRLRTTGLADDIGVSLLPAGPSGRYTFLGGSGLAVWQGSTEKDIAVEFVQFLTSSESQQRFTENGGLLPARRDVLQSPTFTQDPDYSVFAEAIAYGRDYPRIEEWAAIEVALTEEFEELWFQIASFPNTATQEENLRQQVNEQVTTINQLLSP